MVVDLSLSSLFAGWAMAGEIQRRLAADGMADLRFADGFVFQHLVEGPVTIGALAERLEVTQQAASKSVADLERRGYVERLRDPGDARARLVALTERGRGAVEGARSHRASLVAELGERLGPRRVEAANRLLQDVVAELGADTAVRGRRVLPPT
jgi:DNA-binding MarR family transcriptional regulator